MSRALERFHRIVRERDPKVIEAPHVAEVWFEDGVDPRRPATASARYFSRRWAEMQINKIKNDTGVVLEAAVAYSHNAQKEVMERPMHYPVHYGLGLIPSENTVGGYAKDKFATFCYTALNVPRPFDPSLHGAINGNAGLGYMGLTQSQWPDEYDLTTKRGGGPRGGFSFTTGPTEGNYPTGILPQPTFNLGRLGYSNGGWNPEGLQWTNRPKRVKLVGLRNNAAHRVMFARSRRVMFRNLYGPVSEDEATPKAPTVVVNGTRNLNGVLSVRCKRKFNAPSQVTIEVNSIAGRRSGFLKLGDTVQVFAAPRMWSNPPLVFTGFVSDVEESSQKLTVIALDTLGYLTKEVLTSELSFRETDAGAVIRDIIGASSYGPPIGKISTQTRIILPETVKLKGKTRLQAVQTILDIVNNTPNDVVLRTEANGFINLIRLREIEDTNFVPFVAGRLPRTSVPQDIYPTEIRRDEGEIDFVNKVTITNSDLNISVTEPAVEPQRPNHIQIEEKSAGDENTARFFAKQYLNQQGRSSSRWTVKCLPERLDIMPGDIIDFASKDGGLAGRQRVFDVSWNYGVNGVQMSISVGRQSADLVSTLRYASNVSQ